MDGHSSDTEEREVVSNWEDSPHCRLRETSPSYPTQPRASFRSAQPVSNTRPSAGGNPSRSRQQPLPVSHGSTERTDNTGTSDLAQGVETGESEELDDPVQDTVGVVVLDRLGNVASSVSSGGLGKSGTHTVIGDLVLVVLMHWWYR